MTSKKAASADNQQERLKFIGWLVGFTDGEGCFSVSIIRNNTSKFGWQVFPEFVITQGEKSLPALKKIKNYFDCGNLFINYRHDNHKENLYRYCVRAVNDLKEKILPFYQQNQLITAKSKDFEKFCQIINLMSRQKHGTIKGLKQIAKIISRMNRKVCPIILKSSETICRNLRQKDRRK